MSDAPLKVWLDRDGTLLRLRLNTPKANIIDAEMIAALTAAFDEYKDNDGLLGVLLDHDGPHFSFGASVEEHLPGQCAEMLKGLHDLVKRMVAYPVPVLVAVRGQCLGGGLEVAAAGNFIFN
ncbi:MAG: enoyl-CoA hydratase/isomerase family protein, partial [Rhodospirillales bacterium]|nr:enoyl-CoA hydratase/isomerase family protein [Rhodospirillales bacterium]